MMPTTPAISEANRAQTTMPTSAIPVANRAKTTGYQHNCGLNSLVHALASTDPSDPDHSVIESAYIPEETKEKFRKFYLEEKRISKSWREIVEIFKRIRNPVHLEIAFGPVLRRFIAPPNNVQMRNSEGQLEWPMLTPEEVCRVANEFCIAVESYKTPEVVQKKLMEEMRTERATRLGRPLTPLEEHRLKTDSVLQFRAIRSGSPNHPDFNELNGYNQNTFPTPNGRAITTLKIINVERHYEYFAEQILDHNRFYHDRKNYNVDVVAAARAEAAAIRSAAVVAAAAASASAATPASASAVTPVSASAATPASASAATPVSASAATPASASAVTSASVATPVSAPTVAAAASHSVASAASPLSTSDQKLTIEATQTQQNNAAATLRETAARQQAEIERQQLQNIQNADAYATRRAVLDPNRYEEDFHEYLAVDINGRKALEKKLAVERDHVVRCKNYSRDVLQLFDPKDRTEETAEHHFWVHYRAAEGTRRASEKALADGLRAKTARGESVTRSNFKFT